MNDATIYPPPTPPTPPIRKTLWAWTVGTFFGAGFWKYGPGTAGSVAAAAIWFVVGRMAWVGPAKLSAAGLAWLTAGAALAALAAGIPASSIVARECGWKDPGIVVIDEACGQWITLLGVPADWRLAIIGLILFRLFDIWKPSPIRLIERLPRGWGIMLDDVGAGIYALIVLQLIYRWIQ